MKRLLLTLLSLLVTSRLATAIPIASNTAGSGIDNFIPGQSFTVVAPGPVNNVVFNFFSDATATTPTAFGTGFLLSSEFLGLPSALSNATPGFLGMATAAGGFYSSDTLARHSVFPLR